MQKKKYVAKYEEVEKIGEGASGQAYLVLEKQSCQFMVAKKFNLKATSEKEISQAFSEISIFKELNNPFIVKYIQSFRDGHELIIIMEYCEEGDLAYHIKWHKSNKKHFSEESIVNWFIQMLVGLSYLHNRKILHRDIKTNNIFLTSSRMIKIGDFGISKQLAFTDQLASTLVGTPCYMSPEIISDKKYNYKSDIWSLGCVLYQLCTLKRTFDVKNGSVYALFRKICKGQFQDINGQLYSRDLSNLIKTVLNKDLDKRPSIEQIMSFPIIKKHMQSFINSAGHIKGDFPLKGTKLHQEVNRQIKIREKPCRDNYKEDDQTLTAKEKIDRKKLEKARSNGEEIIEATIRIVNQNRGVARQRRDRQMRGSEGRIQIPVIPKPIRKDRQPINLPTVSSKQLSSMEQKTVIKASNLLTVPQAIRQQLSDSDYEADFEPYQNQEVFRISPPVDEKIFSRAVDQYTLCLSAISVVPTPPLKDMRRKLETPIKSQSEKMRQSCIDSLGQVRFREMYNFVRQQKMNGINGDVIRAEFKEYFGKLSLPYVFKIEELIYIQDEFSS